jgi:hypothetical protein
MWSPRAAQRVPKALPGTPKGAHREAKGSLRDPKGATEAAQGYPQGTQRYPKEAQRHHREGHKAPKGNPKGPWRPETPSSLCSQAWVQKAITNHHKASLRKPVDFCSPLTPLQELGFRLAAALRSTPEAQSNGRLCHELRQRHRAGAPRSCSSAKQCAAQVQASKPSGAWGAANRGWIY